MHELCLLSVDQNFTNIRRKFTPIYSLTNERYRGKGFLHLEETEALQLLAAQAICKYPIQKQEHTAWTTLYLDILTT